MDDIELRTQLENHHTVSFGWALSCCRHDSNEAKDILQMAYLKVLDGRARFNGRSSFKTWLFSVIRNTAAEERRRHWFRRLGLAKFASDNETGEICEEAHVPGKEAELEAFRASLSQLPNRQEQILHLVFYQDLTLEEASAVMGVSIGSARTHYDRAKKNLRNLLEKMERPDESR